MARSTRRWRGVAVAAIVLTGALGVAGQAAATPSSRPALAVPGPQVHAQVAPAEGDGATDTATDSTPSGGSTVEKVTTTETRLRRVVIGLIAVAVVTALLTLGYAHHTSPRRRARAAEQREAARARRLATAAAVGDLGTRVVDPEPEVVALPETETVAVPEPQPQVEPQHHVEHVAERRLSPPVDAPVRRKRARPSPRPQPRRST